MENTEEPKVSETAETPEPAEKPEPALEKKEQEHSSGDKPVVIGKGIRVFPRYRLPLLDMPQAKAYQAEDMDGGHLYALVCDPDLPIRMDHVRTRVGMKTKGLLPLVDAGVAYWKPLKRRTMILVYQTPLGGRVVTTDKFVSPLPREESELVQNWIRPVMGALNYLAVSGLTHRAIRPDNFFYLDAEKTQVVLGDCITAPPAFDQPAECETIGSILCQPDGRGYGTIEDDLYAFGASLITLLLGYTPTQNMTDSELLKQKVKKGSYAALVDTGRLPLSLIELLRGLLYDDADQRWNLTTVEEWMGGRRLPPMQAKSFGLSQRPFMFNNEEFYSCRALAVAFVCHKEMAAEAIRSDKFISWLAHGFEDKSMAEDVRRALELAPVSFPLRERQDEYLVSHICLLFNPSGPLCLRGFSFMPDAWGILLARAFLDDKDIKPLTGIITSGLLEDAYILKGNRTAAQKIKSWQMTLKRLAIGQGIEYLLYSLNTGFPCRSPLIKQEYVTDIRGLMEALEKISKDADVKSNPLDRHIAAFIAVNYPDKVSEQLSWVNSSRENVAAQGLLSLFSTLQRVFGPDKLFGLCAWLGRHILPMVQNYHNLEKRQQLEKDLPKYIHKGSLIDMYRFLDNRDERLSDSQGFEQARRDYFQISQEIEFLDGNREKRNEDSLKTGYELATIFSFSIAFLMIVFLLFSRYIKG